MRGVLFCKKAPLALPLKNFIYDIFLIGRTKTYLLMNPQPFLFHLCYPHNLTFGTKTRFKGCTITVIILPSFTHLVVPFLSTTVCTVAKIRYRTGGIEIPLGIFKGAALNCTFRHFLHEKWCARAA